MNNKSLFFGMELSDKKTLLITDDRISTLGKLHEALTHAWSRETAFPACKGDWSTSNPALGQCTITAMIVHDLFGGTIHRVRLSGGGTHYFNRIDGVYVDLTSSQFADYANECPLEPNEERGREHCGITPNTWNRYRLLIDNINAWILSESDDGRITPLMPSGTAPEPYRKGRRTYEEVAGGYASTTGKDGYSKPYNKGNEKTSAKYSKYGKDGNAKIRRAMGVCPECGGALVKRSGKYGDFLGCTHYPECHFTVPLEKAELNGKQYVICHKQWKKCGNADTGNGKSHNRKQFCTRKYGRELQKRQIRKDIRQKRLRKAEGSRKIVNTEKVPFSVFTVSETQIK